MDALKAAVMAGTALLATLLIVMLELITTPSVTSSTANLVRFYEFIIALIASSLIMTVYILDTFTQKTY